MKKRKALAIFMAIAMVFCYMPITAFADVTADVTEVMIEETLLPTYGPGTVTSGGSGYVPLDMPREGFWSTAALQALFTNGLLNGFEEEDGIYIRPNDPLTRAQMAAIVNRAFRATEISDLTGVTDVQEDSWFFSDIQKAVSMGTMMLDTRMRPNDNITRQEAFLILARALKLKDGVEADFDNFADASQVASWSTSGTGAMVREGYIMGSNNLLKPTDIMTRAEFAVVIYNIIKKGDIILGDSVIVPEDDAIIPSTGGGGGSGGGGVVEKEESIVDSASKITSTAYWKDPHSVFYYFELKLGNELKIGDLSSLVAKAYYDDDTQIAEISLKSEKFEAYKTAKMLGGSFRSNPSLSPSSSWNLAWNPEVPAVYNESPPTKIVVEYVKDGRTYTVETQGIKWIKQQERLDTVAPLLTEVTPTRGAVALASGETFKLVVDAYDQWSLRELEIDHIMYATLPQFSVYAFSPNPYGHDKKSFDDAGVIVTYDADEQKWEIDFGETVTSKIVSNEGITFSLVIKDMSGNKFGSMDPATADNTFTYTVTRP